MALPEINQENVHLFIPFKIAKVTQMLVENDNMNWEEAFIKLYNSKIYEELEKEETKIWHEGATYIYQTFKMEMDNSN